MLVGKVSTQPTYQPIYAVRLHFTPREVMFQLRCLHFPIWPVYQSEHITRQVDNTNDVLRHVN